MLLVLLSFGPLQGIPGLQASNPGHGHLDDSGFILYEAGQSSYPSFLQVVREVPPPGQSLYVFPPPTLAAFAPSPMPLESRAALVGGWFPSFI